MFTFVFIYQLFFLISFFLVGCVVCYTVLAVQSFQSSVVESCNSDFRHLIFVELLAEQ